MRSFGDREKGWPRDAREGMGHPDAGDARQSFDAMRAVRTGVAVVAVLTCLVATSTAWAHGYAITATSHDGEGCSPGNRVSHGTSTCIHGWWDNTPPASSGHALGSSYGAENGENQCNRYGSFVVNVDIRSTEDRHFHLAQGTWLSSERSHDLFNDVRQISCCWDRSDLCYIKEVIAENNVIMRHTSGTSWVYEYVGRHQQRYDLCQSYPDIIYCKKNPSGDAFTPPAPPPTPALPEVSLQDCYDNFEESPAADVCEDFTARAPPGTRGSTESERRAIDIELSNGMCREIYATCERHRSPLGGARSNHADDLALADVVNIEWCNWTVEVYRANPRRPGRFLGGTREYWALLADACPESTVQYMDANGNPIDPP